jgi:hypothetical protein
MPNYQQSKIYKIVCSKTNKIYVGATTQKYLSSRLSGHKYRNVCMCRDFVEPKIYLLENYPCNSKKELDIKEEEYRLKIDCVNKRSVLPMDIKEYRKKYEEEHKEHRKQYREEHKEKIKQQKREWYLKNREKILKNKKNKISV